MWRADEDRRVALGELRGLGVAEPKHQVHEVGRFIALEAVMNSWSSMPNEYVVWLWIVRGILVADPDVLGHCLLAVLLGERVPRTDLHERIHDEVGRALRTDLARAPRAAVYCEALVVARYEYGVEPPRERRRVQRRAELAEILVARRDLPEEEVGRRHGRRSSSRRAGGRTAPRARRRRRRRRPWRPRAPRREAAELRVEPEEGVGHVLPVHGT